VYIQGIYKLIMSEQKTFPVRVEKDLLDSFQAACKSNDITASQAVRAFMRDYVRKHGQSDLFKQK
jgi:antitoxin component of RelBE/YafQ-DinJ toxin-antitoxin module